MKKVLHLLLLVFYLLSYTQLRELTKLPVLFQHYYEHKNVDTKITFYEYLEHHYNDIPHTDEDDIRDSQLPFKTLDIFSAGALNAALPALSGLVLKRNYSIISSVKIAICNDYLPNSAYAGKIWQPPKV